MTEPARDPLIAAWIYGTREEWKTAVREMERRGLRPCRLHEMVEPGTYATNHEANAILLPRGEHPPGSPEEAWVDAMSRLARNEPPPLPPKRPAPPRHRPAVARRTPPGGDGMGEAPTVRDRAERAPREKPTRRGPGTVKLDPFSVGSVARLATHLRRWCERGSPPPNGRRRGPHLIWTGKVPGDRAPAVRVLVPGRKDGTTVAVHKVLFAAERGCTLAELDEVEVVRMCPVRLCVEPGHYDLMSRSRAASHQQKRREVTAFVQAPGDTVRTPWGRAEKVRVQRYDGEPMAWPELYRTFTDAYPGQWALQLIPPGGRLVDEANIYHLLVLPIGAEPDHDWRIDR